MRIPVDVSVAMRVLQEQTASLLLNPQLGGPGFFSQGFPPLATGILSFNGDIYLPFAVVALL